MANALRTVGRYEILHEIGRGGMAIVYLARQTDLARNVALKELSAFHATDRTFAQRFLRESRVAGSLSHPNIVTVHDYFEHGGTPYIAMEFVDRGSLRPYAKRMSLAQIAGVLEGVLAGLAHAETAGIVHRDLKPENLMVTSEGRVKIGDFGIAKAQTEMSTSMLTATGMAVGTPTYMAPEQAMAMPIGPWTDLYSTGIIAYELLCGQVPFSDAERPMAILMHHVNDPPPPPRSVNPALDPALCEWVEALLVKDPAKRTRSAVDAWDALEEILIRLLGPRWRREARLLERAETIDTPRPLTPAPFEGTLSRLEEEERAEEDDEFESFHVGAVPPAGPPPKAPEPSTPPVEQAPAQDMPAEALPVDVEPVAGEAQLEEAGPSEADSAPEPASPTGFATFHGSAGAPSPPTAPEPGPIVEEPVEEQPSPEHRDEAPPADREPAQTSGFVTFLGSRGVDGAPPSAEAVEVPPKPEPVEPEPVEPVATAPEPVAAEEPPTEAATIAPRAVVRPETHVPAQPAAAPSAGRTRSPAIVLALALVGLAAVGYLIAPTSSSDEQPRLASSASGGAVRIDYPDNWRRMAAIPPLPGVTFAEGAIGIEPAARPGSAAVIAGEIEATGPTLLPTDLLNRLGTAPPKTAVRLGRLQAYRYDGLRPSGYARSLTMYVAPTTGAVATVACVAPQNLAAEIASDCAHMASTLQITAGKPVALGPSRAYATGLGDALEQLGAARRSGRSKLGTTKTAAGQASTAGGIALAYARAKTALSRLAVGPLERHANTSIATELRGAQRAYERLASGARARSRSRYNAARADVARAERRVTTAVSELKALGYEVAG